jgi:hypothetical protein
VLNAALKAEDRFQTAQDCVNHTAKALEYKWPVDPINLNSSVVPGIVQARTSSKIKQYMEELESMDTSYTASFGSQLFYWNFSLRKDYLGMTFDKVMPGTGITMTAVEQFQQYLADLRNREENLVDLSEDGTPDHLAIPFSTVKFAIQDDDPGFLTIKDSTGNSQQAEGRPIFDARLWDDKIDWIQVNIVGNQVYSNPSLMPIDLWYGGSGFVRYLEPLPLGPNGEATDHRVIPVPQCTMTNTSRGFLMKGYPYLKQAFSAKLVTEPREVPTEIYRTINFREHPVAATDWRLLIPLQGTNLQNIRDIEVIIVHRARTRL